MVEVRPYRDGDEKAVAALWREVFPDAPAHRVPEDDIRRKLRVQADLFLVAADGPEVVGTTMAGYDGHRGWIYSLAVHPDYRQTGVATALMRTVEAALVKLGCFKINLQVLPNNRTVVDFYTKLGYAIEERVSLAKILPENL